MTLDVIIDCITDQNLDTLRNDYGSVKMYAQCVWKLPPAISAMIEARFSDEIEPEPIPDRLERILIRARRE